MPLKVVKTYADESTDPHILDIWRSNWARNGWDTKVITQWDARRHRKYRDDIDPKAIRWMAFAVSGGGLLVNPEVLCGKDEIPPLNRWNIVSLSKEGAGFAVIATAKGAEERASNMANGVFLPTDGMAELCVEAGSSDWESAPLVHFSDRSCKQHKRDKIQWMKEFSQKNC